MKFKYPTNKNLFSKSKGAFKSLFLYIWSFFKRVYRSVFLLSKLEKIIVVALFCLFLSLVGIKAKDGYLQKTKPLPDFGGTYKEAIYGELKYLNPVLASGDIDKSTSSLIFSSLFKFDKNNNITPDAADSWSISEDKLVYTVNLKKNVYFHDGVKLVADDVVYTVQTIQDPLFKSPLYEKWKDIQVSATDENTVTFVLPKIYGPFIYELDFGILPAHLPPDEFAKKIIGSGPYKYLSAKKTGDKFNKLYLESNQQYYNERPYIDEIELDFFDQKDDALTAVLNDKSFTAISGVASSPEKFADLSYSTTKSLALIPNLRTDRFKLKDFRTLFFSDQKLAINTKITLTTADAELQKIKAEELKKQFADRNIDLDIKYLKPTEMKAALDAKNYELLLYGFDFGHDKDPYVFWHTSQLDKMNFAGYSDKKFDIALEDARMVIDNTIRNEKYDVIFATIKAEGLAVFYDPIKTNFFVQNNIKGIIIGGGCDADSKYSGINKWYIEEKRVKK